MPYQPHSILVTGGAGFIGSNYLNWMVPRYPEVTFLNLDLLTYAGNLQNLSSIEEKSNYNFAHGDVSDKALVNDLFDEYAFDTVVHFAAESHVDRSIENPLSFVHSNVVGTVNLLHAALEAWGDHPEPLSVRFHHISTDEVYGSLGYDGQFTPDSPYDPRSPYAASKAASDHFVRAFGQTYGLPVVITNSSNNYGPYQFPEKLIPLTIVNAVDQKPIPIYGRGENVRDWLYVLDHCDALERVLREGSTGNTYLIGGGNELSNLELVHNIVDLVDDALSRPRGTGRSLIQFVRDRPGHDFRYAVDTRLIEKELEWTPEHALHAGLKSTVDWYLKHTDWLEAVRDASYRDYYDRMYGNRLG